MTSKEYVQAQLSHDGQETSFIQNTGTSLNDAAFQTIASTENSSAISKPGLSQNHVPDTSTNDDALQMVVLRRENSNNNEPESENRVALPFSNSHIIPLDDWSSRSEWSVSTESSVECDERSGQLVQHTPNGANQLQLPQRNAPQVNYSITGNKNVYPEHHDTKNFNAPVTNHNNFYCCSSERCCGCKLASNKRCIVGVTVTSLGITFFIFSCIWFSIPNTSKQLYVPVAFTNTPPRSVKPTDSIPRFKLFSKVSDSPIPDLRVVSRTEWFARSPLKEKLLSVSPVNLVIIMHTGRLACFDRSECTNAVKSLQEIDMVHLGKTDISYNWLVGGDGLVYTGRGWNIEGDHTKDYDNRTIGIVFIGNFETKLPTSAQIRSCEKLIQKGVDEKWIDKDYKLVGHKQCARSNNPGKILYNIIKNWPEWSPACL